MLDEPDLQLVLRVLPDPHAGHGRPARDGMYRLKVLLKIAGRQLGLKCVSISDVGPGEVVPCAAIGGVIPAVGSCKACNPVISG